MPKFSVNQVKVASHDPRVPSLDLRSESDAADPASGFRTQGRYRLKLYYHTLLGLVVGFNVHAVKKHRCAQVHHACLDDGMRRDSLVAWTLTVNQQFCL